MMNFTENKFNMMNNCASAPAANAASSCTAMQSANNMILIMDAMIMASIIIISSISIWAVNISVLGLIASILALVIVHVYPFRIRRRSD